MTVPRGWVEIPFQLLFRNVTSSSRKLPQREYLEYGRFPVIDQGEDHIGGHTDREELVHPGPLPVVAFGDHTRAVKYVDRPFVQGADGLKVLAPAAHVDPRYAYWALRQSSVPSRGYARHFALLRRLAFPLPPRSEQQAIVETVESYLTRLDDAVASLERVQRNLERYRASVLKAAVEGRLVPTEAELARREGRDYEPAGELLKRILAERKSRWIENAAEKARTKSEEQARRAGKPWTAEDDARALQKARTDAQVKYMEPSPPETTGLPDLPEGWCWAAVDQLGETSTGRTPSTSQPEFFGGELPFATPPDLHDAPLLKTERTLSSSGGPEARVVPSGSVLVCCIGSLGKTALTCRSVAFNQQINAITPARSMRPAWLFLSVRTVAFAEQLASAASATTVTIVNKRRFNGLAVPLAPQDEQLRVLAETDRLCSLADVARDSVDRQLARCAAERQAILKWAFEGRLVEQDPNDEPAAVLLERIKAVREKAAAGGKGGKRRCRS